MATKLIWYDVIDLTSYALKYPKDWYYRSHGNYNAQEYPVNESLGKYSSEEKAIQRLKKWAEEKGLDPELMTKIEEKEPIYYEDDWAIDCIPICELGIIFMTMKQKIRWIDSMAQRPW